MSILRSPVKSVEVRNEGYSNGSWTVSYEDGTVEEYDSVNSEWPCDEDGVDASQELGEWLVELWSNVAEPEDSDMCVWTVLFDSRGRELKRSVQRIGPNTHDVEMAVDAKLFDVQAISDAIEGDYPRSGRYDGHALCILSSTFIDVSNGEAVFPTEVMDADGVGLSITEVPIGALIAWTDEELGDRGGWDEDMGSRGNFATDGHARESVAHLLFGGRSFLRRRTKDLN